MANKLAGDSEAKEPAEPSGLAAKLDRYFGLSAAGTSVPTELRAGLATFLTMAYIMFVNPAILEKAGMDHGAVVVATCLAAALSTAIMGLYANYPHRARPWHGAQRLFRLHHGARAWRQLAARAWHRVPVRRAVSPDFTHTIARMADQRHSASLDFDLDIRPCDAHIVARGVVIGRRGEYLSGADIEPRPMPRAGHFMALDVSLGQGAFFVRAGVVEGKEVALDIKQGDFLALDIDQPSVARRDLVRARDLHKLAHCPQAWTLKQPCRAVAVREANCAWLIWTNVS